MASRRARRRRRQTRHIALRIFLVFLITVLLLSGAATTVAYATVTSWLKDLPDANAAKVAQVTKIYSADGKLLARLYLENREVVPLDKMSKNVQNGVIAVEDERFYQHQGYDIVGIVRALVKDVTAGNVREGASTLTQQYVRQTLLQREATKITIARKIREIYLAQELEKRYTKDEILAMYLNTVYFGDGAYGIEAAAKHYFNKSAKDLDIAQAAMLAGIPQSPTRLTPTVKENAKRAIDRQHWVLAKMLEQGYITQAEYKKALAEKLRYQAAPEEGDGIYQAPYFVSYVKKQLQDMYGTSMVFKGGLKVYTTLDTRMQRDAERARDHELDQTGDPEAAVVSIDPKTGYVKAMVGGRNFAKNQFNLAGQGKRQPGSSFKMFTLVTALEKGIPPYRAFDSDSPAVIPGKSGAPDWVVYNSEGKGEGWITLEEATAKSVNCVFARLIDELGASSVAATAKRMGITTNIPPYDSITLGTTNCTPLEMASAYGTLAANGVHYKAQTITKVISPEGKVMYDGKPQGKQAISREVAYATTQVLQHVIWDGTATSADIGRPAAGKTGTSENYRDAWFVGYTPQLVTAVWVGYLTETPMEDVHGERGFGGTLAAPIWADYMSTVLEGQPAQDFQSADSPDYTWHDDWHHAGYGQDRGNGNNGNNNGNGTGTNGGGNNNGTGNNGGGTGNNGTGNNNGGNNNGGGGGNLKPKPPPSTNTSGN